MLRIHFLQRWFGLSDPAMELVLHDVSLYCEFVRLGVFDATLITVPRFTERNSGEHA